MVFSFLMRDSCLVHCLPSEPRNVWFTSMEQRGQQGLYVKQWIPMEQHKAYSLKPETGIATPELAITKHHPLENDLQAQDSTAASSPWQDSCDTTLTTTCQSKYIRKARHHDHLYDMRCVWFRSTKLPSFPHKTGITSRAASGDARTVPTMSPSMGFRWHTDSSYSVTVKRF